MAVDISGQYIGKNIRELRASGEIEYLMNKHVAIDMPPGQNPNNYSVFAVSSNLLELADVIKSQNRRFLILSFSDFVL